VAVAANLIPPLMTMGVTCKDEFSLSKFESNTFLVAFGISLPYILELIIDYVYYAAAKYRRNDRVNLPKKQYINRVLFLPSLFMYGLILLPIPGLLRCEVILYALVGLGQTLAIATILANFHHVNPIVWTKWKTGSILLCFSASRFLLTTSRATESADWSLSVTIGFLAAAILLMSCVSRRYFSNHSIGSNMNNDSSAPSTKSIDQHLVPPVVVLSLIFFIVQIIAVALHMTATSGRTLLDENVLAHILLVVVSMILVTQNVQRDLNNVENKMAEEKTFVRYISHEIRSPLSVAAQGLDYLLRDINECPANSQDHIVLRKSDMVDLVGDCKQSCGVAMETLNDLLLFDKISSNMLEVQPRPMLAARFILETTKPLRIQALAKGIHVVVLIEKERHMNAIVDIDLHKMEQVLRNFLTNAIKFTPDNGRVVVRMKLQRYFTDPPHEKQTLGPQQRQQERGQFKHDERDDDEDDEIVRVEVNDDGAGIAAENLSKLFGQYVQFDANRLQAGGGSGLGLWLSKAIVEMHGGRIGAQSDGEGKGTTMFFELPKSNFNSFNSSFRSAAAESTRSVLEDSLSDSHRLSGNFSESNASLSDSNLDFASVTSSLKQLQSAMEGSGRRALRDNHSYQDAVNTSPTSAAARAVPQLTTGMPAAEPNSSSDRGISNETMSQKEEKDEEEGTEIEADVIDQDRTKRQSNNLYTGDADPQRMIEDSITEHVLSTRPPAPVSVPATAPASASQNEPAAKAAMVIPLRRRQSAESTAQRLKREKSGLKVRRNDDSHLSLSFRSPSSPPHNHDANSHHDQQQGSPSEHNNNSSNNNKSNHGDVSAADNNNHHHKHKPNKFDLSKLKLKILIADDAPLARKMLQRMLSVCIRDCQFATTGLQAVDMVKASMLLDDPFDVVITDLNMPEMNGDAAIRCMRSVNFEGVVIAATGSDAEEDHGLISRSGADSVLVKPITLEDVSVVLEKMFIVH